MDGRIVLLTGKPGVGKSTLLRKVVNSLPEDELCGFLTEEVRGQAVFGRDQIQIANGERIGFQLVSVNSPVKRKWLARRDDLYIPNSVQFGRWFVSLDNIAYFVDNYLSTPKPGQTLILDEIGPMQCLNHNFMKRVERLLKGAEEGDYKIIGTIKLDECKIPLIDDFLRKVKKFVGDGIMEVREDNRDDLFA